MKHIIGIDFGTSTSMIKTAIRNGNADSLETKPVTFTQQGIGATPTLIRKLGDTVWYGFEAEQNERLDAPLIRNFKLGLRSENPEEKKQATAYVQEFYAYLYVQYQEQKSFLFGMEPGEEETWVSYPVQWSEEQRNVVLDAARTAGFPNVHGLDEPTAAVICILKAKQRELEAVGLLRQGKPLHAVVLDMGAGTTDLAFITVTVDAKGLHTNLRGIWPDAGSRYIYGGSQMDARLEELLEKWVESCGFPPDKAYNMVVAQRSAIKHWKENTVSPLLANGQTVSDYAGLSATLNMMGQMVGLPVQPFPGLSKERFFAQFAPELKSFVEVISSAPQKLRNETELVILTGGNSEWFWVRDVLLGKESQYGDVGLKGIQSDKNVIRMGQPAETVSRGLVYERGTIELSRDKQQSVLKTNLTPKPVIQEEESQEGMSQSPETVGPANKCFSEEAKAGIWRQPFKMYVQKADYIPGSGAVAIGVINFGEIFEGEYVTWQRHKKGREYAKVAGIYMNGLPIKSASCGMRISLIMEGIKQGDIPIWNIIESAVTRGGQQTNVAKAIASAKQGDIYLTKVFDIPILVVGKLDRNGMCWITVPHSTGLFAVGKEVHMMNGFGSVDHSVGEIKGSTKILEIQECTEGTMLLLQKGYVNSSDLMRILVDVPASFYARILVSNIGNGSIFSSKNDRQIAVDGAFFTIAMGRYKDVRPAFDYHEKEFCVAVDEGYHRIRIAKNSAWNPSVLFSKEIYLGAGDTFHYDCVTNQYSIEKAKALTEF